MKQTYLLDTNVLSEPVRPQPDARVLQLLKRHHASCFTAAPVWHELNAGVLRMSEGHRKRVLMSYLQRLAASQLVVLPYDQRAKLSSGSA